MNPVRDIKMKVLMISTDRKIFDKKSSVRARMVDYGDLVDELHIVVFSAKIHRIKGKKQKISDNVWVYPTNSLTKLSYISKAKIIGSNILSKQRNLNGWIITTQDPFETGLVGKKLSLMYKIPLEVQIHTDFLNPHFIENNYLNQIRVFLAKGVLKHADCVRVVSKKIADSMYNMGYKIKTDSDPRVLPIFVDTKKIENSKPKFNLHKKYSKFKNIILMTTRLELEKNVSLTITAFKSVVKKYPKTGLVIVGDGRERMALKSQVERLGLEDKVIFEGWQDDLISYYKGADIFLNTSNYEGYGLSIVEAVASGLPVLTTDVGMIGGLFIDNEDVLVCNVGDSRCISRKLKKLIEDKKLRKKLISTSNFTLVKNSISKPEYLRRYKKGWEQCL